MKQFVRSFRGAIVLTVILLSSIFASAGTVPVHDPSVVVVYKDANGNSYAENDGGGMRTKYYYIFGTQLGAAYSTDMINWMAFTPTFLLNGTVSTNYYSIFKPEADYAKQLTTDEVKGNLWAPDVIYNTSMKKWCMYFSLSGYDFKSSIILLTSDKVEGPYAKVGAVVYGGFTNNETSVGRTDYQKVIGSGTVDARYLKNNAWFNDYGVSCIDPSVLYDENGKLWLSYGSWSGGIFLLKLSETTGLRDYAYTYGTSPVWSGTRLRSDPYMGIHIAGGYYVSGEGPYIEYIKDKDGVGYYYLFLSMGFYSPEGGYTMRVFRAKTIDGVYTDVTGDEAVFAKYIFNYGANVQYGFPIMQNYTWSWWASGSAQVAQGHNSVLQEQDGSTYLIYHRKLDDKSIHHNVEVHQLYINEKGWPVASPFEYRVGFGMTDKTYTAEDIAGQYGVITHNAVDYAKLATNRETPMYLNADGTVTGAYTGTWTYNYSSGKQYLTLTTSAGMFQCVVCEQLMDGLSSKTLAFTGMNAANERALWGYRYANTATATTTVYRGESLLVGRKDYSLAFDALSDFNKQSVNGDFEIEYTFINHTKAAENWHNWAVTFVSGNERWVLRADAFSTSTIPGTTVNYAYQWNWDTQFKDVFANKEIRLKLSKNGTSINVIAFVNNTQAYTATATNCPAGKYDVYLGGESCYLDVSKLTVSQLGARQLVGVVNDDGTYPAVFNVYKSQLATVSGDFELKYSYNNYRNPVSKNNWDNYILRVVSGSTQMYLRPDAYTIDALGSMSYTLDWDWEDFLTIMSGASIEMRIARTGTEINYTSLITACDGTEYHYTAKQTGAPTGTMSFGFTCEKSMVDILRAETVSYVGTDLQTTDCAGTVNGTAHLDFCDICVGGTTGLVACTTTQMQAESMCQYDGKIDDKNAGYEGSGFVDITNVIGAKCTFYMYASDAMSLVLGIRYANGGATDRAGTMFVNGTQMSVVATFPPTLAWTDYQIGKVIISLNKGMNEIELVSTTADGLPNLDLFQCIGIAEFAACPVIQTIALHQGWNLISTNVQPADSMFENVFEDLDLLEVKNMEGFWRKTQAFHLNSLTHIEAGKGYLVNMRSAAILTITGTPIVEKLQALSPQQSGWNLIGCPYQTAMPINASAGSAAGIFGSTFSAIKNFEGFYIPNNAANSIQDIEPGKAYFVK